MEYAPLAERLRPGTLDEFVGQEHLTGTGKPLRMAMEKQQLFSYILWGPPGVGKTTLARIYAGAMGAEMVEISAVSAGKDDMRRVMETGTNLRKDNKRVILFVDEIHRFNKAQQDFLLPYVERGEVVLVGATTENPSFEVISPLLSRCRVFTLKELSTENMKSIGNRIKKIVGIKIPVEAMNWAAEYANGDARQFISLIEATQTLYGSISVENFKNTLQSKTLRYDKSGEEHYNTISAFIKSMRASDADAAIYYLARMVEAGEDPLFIARRMVIFASEDIGLAVPTALVVANAVFRACETIGYPECQENLAAGVVYLALCKKDRRAYEAYTEALTDVKKWGNLSIPLVIRNAPTKLMKELGYGKGYEKYSKESLLPEKIRGKRYLK